MLDDDDEYSHFEEEELYVYEINDKGELDEVEADGFFYSDRAYMAIHSYLYSLPIPRDDDSDDDVIKKKK